MVFEAPGMQGVAFDDDSRKCVCFRCRKVTVNSAALYNTYTAQIINYEDILFVNVQIDSQTCYQSKSTATDVVGRSLLGGAVAGAAGAMIMGATAPKITETTVKTNPHKISLNIKTASKEIPLIQFCFDVRQGDAGRAASVTEVLTDTMSSTFSDQPYLMENGAWSLKRGCGTEIDCYIKRNSKQGEDVFRKMFFEDIQKKLTVYAQKIEAIILSNQKAPAPAAVPAPAANPTEDKLLKLKSLLEKDLITQEEYQSKKAEVLKDL